jgi:hypothetical protein
MPDEKHEGRFEIPSSYYIFPFGVITRTGLLWDAVYLREDMPPYKDRFSTNVEVFETYYRHAKKKGALSEQSMAIHDRVLAITEEVKESIWIT